MGLTKTCLFMHVFNRLVPNKPSVLLRVSGVLAGSRFSMDSRHMSHRQDTITISGQGGVVEQAHWQLEYFVRFSLIPHQKPEEIGSMLYRCPCAPCCSIRKRSRSHGSSSLSKYTSWGPSISKINRQEDRHTSCAPRAAPTPSRRNWRSRWH